MRPITLVQNLRCLTGITRKMSQLPPNLPEKMSGLTPLIQMNLPEKYKINLNNDRDIIYRNSLIDKITDLKGQIMYSSDVSRPFAIGLTISSIVVATTDIWGFNIFIVPLGCCALGDWLSVDSYKIQLESYQKF